MTSQGKTFRGVTLSELREVALYIVAQLGKFKVWLLNGEMGSGKTTLIKEIGHRLGVVDAMNSPTYAIINEYETAAKSSVFHFDFYRIKHEGEAYDLGVEEYFYSGFPCFIEWPERIPSLIPPRFAAVDIQIEENTRRTIVISFHDGKEENGV
jgi:tRNA threonylcarbamoyladenosine biosynthesis protein TsaE